tara:strand:+ start:931 stop:1548 length:618 start_codon:yes stop_codon:yes gene_type:complete
MNQTTQPTRPMADSLRKQHCNLALTLIETISDCCPGKYIPLNKTVHTEAPLLERLQRFINLKKQESTLLTNSLQEYLAPSLNGTRFKIKVDPSIAQDHPRTYQVILYPKDGIAPIKWYARAPNYSQMEEDIALRLIKELQTLEALQIKDRKSPFTKLIKAMESTKAVALAIGIQRQKKLQENLEQLKHIQTHYRSASKKSHAHLL